MWISEQFVKKPEAEAAGFGEVSISGDLAGFSELGRRDKVHRGALQPETALTPGDVLIYAGDASIRIKTNGEIRLTGRVYVNGTQIGGEGNGA